MKVEKLDRRRALCVCFWIQIDKTLCYWIITQALLTMNIWHDETISIANKQKARSKNKSAISTSKARAKAHKTDLPRILFHTLTKNRSRWKKRENKSSCRNEFFFPKQCVCMTVLFEGYFEFKFDEFKNYFLYFYIKLHSFFSFAPFLRDPKMAGLCWIVLHKKDGDRKENPQKKLKDKRGIFSSLVY